MFAALRSRWARVLAAEEARFNETIGVESPEESSADEETSNAACGIEPQAPSLADMIRKRQQAGEPEDFMFRPDDDRDGKG